MRTRRASTNSKWYANTQEHRDAREKQASNNSSRKKHRQQTDQGSRTTADRTETVFRQC